ncbi:MAG TPA: rhodanese-like domain-containing protein [Thermoanaerobaculia bacterium]
MISSRTFRWIVPILLLALPLSGCSLFRRGERPPYRKLSPPIAFEMIRDNSEMLILDLRPPEEYNGETGHLRRARNFPLDRLPYRLLEIDAFREETILIYCGTLECGERGMSILQSSGFEDAVLMDGGIEAWIREGFKTVLPRTALGRLPEPPADGKGPVRPRRPEEETPNSEENLPTGPPPPVAAPRQIG